ncbi:MAG TPA: pilus assembly protein PilP [Thermoanaerobaculia bacterium]|nr:pilus assembly protein PilP [Thermoanaerobaculia bacterium]
MKISHFTLSLILVVAAVASVVAQSPSTSTTTTGTTATGTASDVQKTLEEILEEPATTDTYRYDPQGRRDPFRSLVGPAPKLEPGQRPPGVPGFMIDEMKLQGVFKTRQGLAAMIRGPDNKGYLIRAGDKVLDGEVIRVTATSVVFRQEVNDPTRIERYREVVKDLTPAGRR